MSMIGVDLKYWLFVIGLVLFGAGMALAGAPATTAITGSLPLAKQGAASAVNDTTREFGSALGIAILGSVLNTAYRNAVTPAAEQLPGQAAEIAQGSVSGAQVVGAQAGPQGQALIDVANQAFVDGASQSLLVAAAVLVTGGLFVFFRAPKKGEK